MNFHGGLEIANLEVTYNRVIVAVQGVSLKVPDNAIVALLGTNGAGKTTTVRAISGFLPVDDAQIKKGSIEFSGRSVLGLPSQQAVRLGIVLVPERRKIFETMTVADNLRIARRDKTRTAEREARIQSLLEVFPALAKRQGQIAGYLSGGERQMLAIAQALVCDPKLLLVDELSLGLAPHLVKDLMNQVRELRTTFGISILVIEQDAASALAIAQGVGEPRERVHGVEFAGLDGLAPSASR